jgi:tetratricopeptide (TPR) repeat protein
MKTIFLSLYLGLASMLALAQPNSDGSREELVRRAIQLMDGGQPAEAVTLLQQGLTKWPKDFFVRYELAYAHYLQKDYARTLELTEELVKEDHPLGDQCYKMMGNVLDLMGKPKKAIKAYEKGLEKYPNSGKIYLELTVMALKEDDLQKALNYCEKGIEVEPGHSSNYYWAAKLLTNSSEKIWAVLYGEMFINLEPRSARTKEISKLLFETYQSAVTSKGDTSIAVSFSQRGNTIYLKNANDFIKKVSMGTALPFEGTWELAMAPGTGALISGIHLGNLHQCRQLHLQNWFAKAESAKAYPCLLFDHHQKLVDSGHFEAYNYWLFSQGEPKAFETWLAANPKAFDQFAEWLRQNPLKLTPQQRLHRWQFAN